VSELLKYLLDWLADIAWPTVVLGIALIYRRPIHTLLTNLGSIAGRAATDPFEVSIGDSLKVVFKESLRQASPDNVSDALQVANDTADKLFSLFDLLHHRLSPLERDTVREVAGAGSDGYEFRPSQNVLRDMYIRHTLQELETKGLVTKNRRTGMLHTRWWCSLSGRVIFLPNARLEKDAGKDRAFQAARRCAADERKKLERLCRYITRPAIANERLALDRAG
jgi:putative transposase